MLKINKLLIYALLPTFLNLSQLKKPSALPLDPNNLPKGITLKYEPETRKGIYKVKVDNAFYNELLIITDKGQLGFATTDSRFKPVNDVETVRKADKAATIAYITEKIPNLEESLAEAAKNFEKASVYTSIYDETLLILKKLIEIESMALTIEVIDGISLPLAFDSAAKEVVDDYKEELVSQIKKELKDINILDVSNLAKILNEKIFNSIYHQLHIANEELSNATLILKQHKGNWSYEEASMFYDKWKQGTIRGLSNLTLWNNLNRKTGNQITLELSNSIAKGVGFKKLEDIIEYVLSEDETNKKAFEAMHQKIINQQKIFRKLELMFDPRLPSQTQSSNQFRTPESTLEYFFNNICQDKFPLDVFPTNLSWLIKEELEREPIKKGENIEYCKEIDLLNYKIIEKEVGQNLALLLLSYKDRKKLYIFDLENNGWKLIPPGLIQVSKEDLENVRRVIRKSKPIKKDYSTPEATIKTLLTTFAIFDSQAIVDSFLSTKTYSGAPYHILRNIINKNISPYYTIKVVSETNEEATVKAKLDSDEKFIIYYLKKSNNKWLVRDVEEN